MTELTRETVDAAIERMKTEPSRPAVSYINATLAENERLRAFAAEQNDQLLAVNAEIDRLRWAVADRDARIGGLLAEAERAKGLRDLADAQASELKRLRKYANRVGISNQKLRSLLPDADYIALEKIASDECRTILQQLIWLVREATGR